MNTSERERQLGVEPQEKPRLAIRRPAQQTKDREHLNAAAAAVDARVRKAERQRRNAKLKKMVGNWISIFALVAAAWLGYVIWRAVQNSDSPETLPAQLTEQVTQFVSNAVEKVNTEIAK